MAAPVVAGPLAPPNDNDVEAAPPVAPRVTCCGRVYQFIRDHREGIAVVGGGVIGGVAGAAGCFLFFLALGAVAPLVAFSPILFVAAAISIAYVVIATLVGVCNKILHAWVNFLNTL